MDKSRLYKKMVQEAIEVWIPKFDTGFEEGDFLWNGEKTVVCGTDYIDMKTRVTKLHKHTHVDFAMIDNSEKASFAFDCLEHVSMKYGRYTFQTIVNPIWLPRQDQLQKMALGKFTWDVFDKKCIQFTQNHNPLTKEQAGLMVIMYYIHDKKIWNNRTRRWTETIETVK